MKLLSLIGSVFKPFAEMVDNVHTSKEEKLQIQQAMFEVQARLSSQAMDYETELLKGKAAIIMAEANGQSWIQRNWRPLTMLTFLVLVVCDSFGWLPFRLAGEAWTLLQIGLGGYVVGRSVEKVAPQLLKKGN